MKKIILAIVLSSYAAFADRVRLPEYNQVASISNSIIETRVSLSYSVDEIGVELAKISPKIDMAEVSITNIMTDVLEYSKKTNENTDSIISKIVNIADNIGIEDVESTSFIKPPVGECQARVTFVINSGDGAYVPSSNTQRMLLMGAEIVATVGNNTYRYKLPSLNPNTSVSTAISVSKSEPMTVSVSLGQSDEVVIFDRQFAKIKEGYSYDIALDCHKAVTAYRQIGRAQVVGANNSTKSYLIVRDSDENGNVVTRFGHYTDRLGTNWFDETGFMNDVRVCRVEDDGSVSWGWNNIDNKEGANTWESQFPWKDFRNIDVELLDANGGTGSSVYKFVEFPIYYVKYDASTPLPFVTDYIDDNGVRVCSTNEINCKVWWLCETQLNGYELPPWEKVWDVHYDTDTASIVREGTPKLKNYYARYKSVDKTKTIKGVTKSVLQSYPWSGTVTGGTRNEDNNRAHYLNDCAISVDGVRYEPDNTGRRFSLNGWNDYMSVAFLTYIHLGVDVQGWVYGNCGSTSYPQSKQNCLEDVFSSDIGFNTFTIGNTSQSQAPFSYFGIVNLWGSEGDQMADATFFQQRMADGNYVGFIMTQLDRSKFAPHETNFETLSALGYSRLTYNTAQTGKESTSYRGLDQRNDYWGFWLTCNDANESAIVTGSIDTAWKGSVPSVSTQGSVVTLAYMCSLSYSRDSAGSMGAWCVSAHSAPSYAYAGIWGARLSMVIPATK